MTVAVGQSAGRTGWCAAGGGGPDRGYGPAGGHRPGPGRGGQAGGWNGDHSPGGAHRAASPRPPRERALVVRGRARMRWGEHLEFMAEADPSNLHLRARTRRSTPLADAEPHRPHSGRTAGPSDGSVSGTRCPIAFRYRAVSWSNTPYTGRSAGMLAVPTAGRGYTPRIPGRPVRGFTRCAG
jgi:hypothetical protein